MVHIGCDVCYVLHNIFAHGIADDTKMYLPQNQTARVIYRHKRVKVSYLHKCSSFIILTLHLTSSRARPSQRKDNNHLTTGRFLSTDFCSTLKITDPSNQKICCTVFSEKLDNHPKIFQIGDIIRMHRVKVRITNTDYSSSHVLYYQIKNTFILFRNFDDRKLESKTSETSSVVLQM